MNLTEAQDLLTIITAYDRGGFPADAARLVWFPALRRVSFEDAKAAVEKHYRINARDPHTGNVRRILPAEVARVAEDIGAARRRREARQAIQGPAPQVGVPAQSSRTRDLLAQFRRANDEQVKRYRESVSAA